MRIGLTFDLREEYLAAGYSDEETAEFDRADTVSAIADALTDLGHGVDRIGALPALVSRLAVGDRWDLVFNICEGLAGVAREAQVPALLEGYGLATTFSDPLVMAVSLHKGLTKTIVAAAGVPTPMFVTVTTTEQLTTLAKSESGPSARPAYPLFVKPVAEGTGKGTDNRSIVRTGEELLAVGTDLLARFPEGILVESYLAGREFTVGLLGTGEAARVLGSLEIVLRPTAEPGVYSYKNKEFCEDLVDYVPVRSDDPVVAEAEAIALDAWRTLGCRDGGRVDLRCDGAGRPQFLEVNPLAGLHPAHSDLPMIATAVGMPYRDLIGAIVTSAAARIGTSRVRTLPGLGPNRRFGASASATALPSDRPTASLQGAACG